MLVKISPKSKILWKFCNKEKVLGICFNKTSFYGNKQNKANLGEIVFCPKETFCGKFHPEQIIVNIFQEKQVL